MWYSDTDRVDWLFNDEVRKKKRLSYQAKRRVKGSKSKKCSLSSDNLTHKQWVERCGKIMTYSLEKPMEWREFCRLPTRVQKEYLLNLIAKYHVTASDLARMFGVTPATVSKKCKEEEIGISFSPGKRMSKKERTEFERFLLVNDRDEDCRNRDNETQEDCSQQEECIEKENGTMLLSNFNLSFSGGFDPTTLGNSLTYMIPYGQQVELTIQCKFLSEGNNE